MNIEDKKQLDTAISNMERSLALAAQIEKVDADGLTKLRRRVEDHLRKNPRDLIIVSAMLASKDSIVYRDIITDEV